MTTVAWDGRRLAADRQTTFGPLRLRTQKLHRLSDGSLVAGSGDTMKIREVIAWLEAGADPDKFKRDDRGFDLLRAHKSGQIQLYDSTSYVGLNIDENIAAVGSGRDYALAAMFLGKSAEDAVIIAAHFDPSAGEEVDVLEPT